MAPIRVTVTVATRKRARNQLRQTKERRSLYRLGPISSLVIGCASHLPQAKRPMTKMIKITKRRNTHQKRNR